MRGTVAGLMNCLWRAYSVLILVGCCGLAPRSWAGPPPQKLPSALLVFPLVQSDGDTDTRVEILNLSADAQSLQCFYVNGSDLELCNEIGFFVSLTPYQPIAWLAGAGFSDTLTGSAVPPFFGTGEMKCVVVPPKPDLEFHNTIQGRATVFASDGKTVSYGAVGFQRLTSGEFTGVVALNGTTYAPCPDKLHFEVLADKPSASPASTSELILVPCSQDLLLQVPTTITVQFLIVNEFEQTFSTAISITCFDRRTLGTIADSLNQATLGTDTAHLVVRGSNGPLLGLAIDGVPFGGQVGTAGNEPSFQGGRSARVVFP